MGDIRLSGVGRKIPALIRGHSAVEPSSVSNQRPWSDVLRLGFDAYRRRDTCVFRRKSGSKWLRSLTGSADLADII
jgi:hypothetical protein